ncbi:hotdog fold thioesterase [Microvirga tunisiensis]|uniref:Hotdog fold thioesterase n=2 Tax=Pannonibacter tanglangensis TaxID=2750084 RepID=A0A7X5J8J3_9HYPH|nr:MULTISPECIES: PaaI family thioesterase [unclassified Pannonibacter]NBN63663.1 hotdog fold thioesterase [Pannonibacter sp. XCT-34]NBN77310.1 hotdog fold thioesterase [Pannonibacter sp. XCT-53]
MTPSDAFPDLSGHDLGALPLDRIATLSGLEIFEHMKAGRLPAPPIMVTMQIVLEEAEQGRAVFIGRPGEAHMNPQGTVHGGWISTILDTAMSCAVHTELKPGELYTTTSLTVNMVRPLMPGSGAVRCEGRVAHRGSRLSTAEGRLVDARGRLIAHGTVTCMILPLQAA